jgi:hypothetical protein
MDAEPQGTLVHHTPQRTAVRRLALSRFISFTGTVYVKR